jgi:opacity protein-like surface antigen
MKTILLLIICFFVLNIPEIIAQNQEKASTKPDQSVMQNDVYLGYGAGGLFYWTGRMKHSSDYPSEEGQQTFTNPGSIGAILLGYNRSLNNVVGLGFLFGFQNFHYTGTTNQGVSTEYNDILLSGMARILFSYVNKPSIRLYSGIGLGITVNFGTATESSQDFTDRKLWPGGQLTFMGIRFGRALGGFFEFGFGTIGIVNAGLSYKFAD